MQLVVGENMWGLMRIVVDVAPDGGVKATFPDWRDPLTDEPNSVEARTVPALVTAVKGALGLG